MSKRMHILPVPGFALFLIAGLAWGQPIPQAPPVPDCAWDSAAGRSTCKFKDALSGTPTSIVGKKVILYDHSNSGGHPMSRQKLREALDRLAARYAFTALATDDKDVFDSANLAETRAVIMSSGEGDVLPSGPKRKALEDFQQVYGWGTIWIHTACAFITSGWPFGQQSCVQQYFHHITTGSRRTVFVDSGTADNPIQGRKNPQSEFLLRNLPGWGGKRSLSMADEWFCFQAPARNTAGVNVLFGFDAASGPQDSYCTGGSDVSEKASQNHNLAWTHMMGKGITVYNSWGHDSDIYTANGNFGDSLLWRYIRYVAKDWCVSGSGEPGCDRATTSVRTSETLLPPELRQGAGGLSVSLTGSGRYEVTLADMAGRRLASQSGIGPGDLEIPGVSRGLYWVRISGAGKSWTRRIMLY